jgi:glycosyltransferase involved in cell wall biosynthesis
VTAVDRWGSHPLVSVLLPVHNAERYLALAIESVLGQSYGDLELLVLDDGSTDGSREIIERYAADDARIRVTCGAHRGVAATLNEGLRQARGELVARMDADDVAMPERLARQVEWLRADPACVVLGTSFVAIDQDGREGRTHHCFVNDVTIRHALPLHPCIPHPTAMFRRSVVVAAGGYRGDYAATEDYDLWRRLAHVGRLHNLPETLLRYRETATQTSTTRASTQATTAERIRNEVWEDDVLAPYRRISLRTLGRLPGEHLPALEDLQRELAGTALRRRDARSFVYLCADLVRFRTRC